MLRSPLRSARLSRALLAATVAALLSTTFVAASAAADPTPTPSTSPSSGPAPAGPVASYLAVTRSAGTVTYGATLTLTGGLSRADGSPIADAPVQVLSRTAGQDSRGVLASIRTDADGRLAHVLSPPGTAGDPPRDGGGARPAAPP